MLFFFKSLCSVQWWSDSEDLTLLLQGALHYTALLCTLCWLGLHCTPVICTFVHVYICTVCCNVMQFTGDRCMRRWRIEPCTVHGECNLILEYCTAEILHCTWILHYSAVFSAQIPHCNTVIINCTAEIVHFTLYTVHCTLYTVQG